MATQIEAQFEVTAPAKVDAIERKADTTPAIFPAANNSMAILERLLERGVALEQAKEFMAFIREQEAHEAKKAYTQAMSDFKAHDIHITKDKTNKQYNSKYTSLGNLIATVTPFLSMHGLHANWIPDQTTPGYIKVTCVMTHKGGHSESVFMVCPPDKSGSKNPIQEIKSAITYAKACTFESICGLASTDANIDDDGNGTGMENVDDWISKFQECEDFAELDVQFRKAYSIASEQNDTDAQKTLSDAKDARRGAIRSRQVRR